MTDPREIIAMELAHVQHSGLRDRDIEPAADAILSALDAAGWVCCPKEPTKEMVVAGDDEKEDCIDSDWASDADGNRHDYTTVNSDIAARIYRAMLAASPERRNALKKENR